MATAPSESQAPVRSRQRSSRASTGNAARALGWFSIGLGVTEVIAPHALGRALGVRRPWTLRALGLREIASGVGLLTQPQQRPAWLWARVAGDAMDLAVLGSAFASPDTRRGRLTAAIGAVGMVTAMDVLTGVQATRERGAVPSAAAEVHATIAVERDPQELYRFWREFANLPRFLHYLEEVRATGEQRSHWVARGPAGRRIEWDTEITEERPNELIAWRSLPGSAVPLAGTVRFEPATNGEGSLVHVTLNVSRGGVLGKGLAHLLRGFSQQQLKVELRRFKQLIETGEVATTQGQPSGRRSAVVKALHTAVQP